MKKLRIGTRKSELALSQTHCVVDKLKEFYPELDIEIKKITTKGDKLLDVSLSKVGGKALFLKEIQNALLNDEIDLAVHSMKDIPTERVEGLEVCAVSKRLDPRDVLVTKHESSLENFPDQAVIGTSSLRRTSQLKGYRNDFKIKPLRGNINTRLNKLFEHDEFDGIVLAKAGLERAGLSEYISQTMSSDIIVPCVGQGALGIEVKTDNNSLIEKLQVLNDSESRTVISAERAFLDKLGGSCHVPVGALGELSDDNLTLTGVVASLDGRDLLRDKITEDRGRPAQLGEKLAEKLIEAGADKILREIE